MLRTFSGRTLLAGPSRFFSAVPARANIFDELKKNQDKVTPETQRNASTVFDIDELIANSPDLNVPLYQRNRYEGYSFGNTAKDPRDVAKGLNMIGSQSGRSVEVKYNNLGMALSGVQRIVNANKIKILQRVQKRHIPKAKYQKEKHRNWWKKQFRVGFQDLMTQVTDAKRRGY